MQGFNKYYPPDYDGEKHGSLNAYRGKHALGDRARKLDQGILITRFELPFNIWCGTCNNHIGMGVRYNAEKKKVGMYHSTPIFAFRCKCHLCDGWFEIQTDPKNTRYVVTSGARKKDEEWDPEENGGFAIHDDNGGPSTADPLAALEKTANAQNHYSTVQMPRLESLRSASERRHGDPYSLSVKVRKRFREEKKVELQRKNADDQIRGRYGLPETLQLHADDDVTTEYAKQIWKKGREEARLLRKLSLDSSQSSISTPVLDSHRYAHPKALLQSRLTNNRAKRLDPLDTHIRLGQPPGIVIKSSKKIDSNSSSTYREQ